ncbi:ABC transporter substrate-binding protein [Propylenella binzhouense]|uniref:Branched-chain amino acid ABC transporter substrate-binding protein n=1 Tax=Propylenella binzhouense TaxID=2555902 RepID=A0A964T222_9HYPH|nr:ABC transporter substrate-binding protein [Propylenella binzhouense]MYZ46920.1 branched-chain amino acid ABC transporter substrate-binding protein [Propylenella binzhouense]
MRKLLAGLSALTLTAVWSATGVATAQEQVTMALAMPLSGAWARIGEVSRAAAECAIADINEAGGIEALGGAKVNLVVADVGGSPESAKNAAERLLSAHPDISGGVGAYVSSFTLPVTEVTERAGIPWLTLSYSERITGRGYKHVFMTSPTSVKQAEDALPTILALAEQATGTKPDTVGIVMDNTPSPVGFTEGMRNGGLKKFGLELVVDQVFTPPLSVAGPIVQQVRSARPDFLLFLPTATPDIKLILEQLTQFGLTRERLPLVNNGGPMGTPDLLNVVGKDLLEGAMFITANWGLKGQEDFTEHWKECTGLPWVTQDISTYGHFWLLKEAMEMAKSADPEAVTQALHAMNLTDGPARFFPGGTVSFAENGRRNNASILIAQWRHGVPVTVFPAESAVAEPVWTGQ